MHNATLSNFVNTAGHNMKLGDRGRGGHHGRRDYNQATNATRLETALTAQAAAASLCVAASKCGFQRCSKRPILSRQRAQRHRSKVCCGSSRVLDKPPTSTVLRDGYPWRDQDHLQRVVAKVDNFTNVGDRLLFAHARACFTAAARRTNQPTLTHGCSHRGRRYHQHQRKRRRHLSLHQRIQGPQFNRHVAAVILRYPVLIPLQPNSQAL